MVQPAFPIGAASSARSADASDPGISFLTSPKQHFTVRLCSPCAHGLIPTVGILHQPRSGAALASDMQEPFRHLMDRAVLAVLPTLKPADFQPSPGGAYATTIRPSPCDAPSPPHATFLQPCTSAHTTDANAHLTSII